MAALARSEPGDEPGGPGPVCSEHAGLSERSEPRRPGPVCSEHAALGTEAAAAVVQVVQGCRTKHVYNHTVSAFLADKRVHLLEPCSHIRGVTPRASAAVRKSCPAS